MEVNQDQPSENQDGESGEVMESLGMPEGSQEESHASSDEGESSKESLAVQKRLKAAKRAHARETRELHARISELESRMAQPQALQSQMNNSYNGQPQGGNVQDHIQQAVNFALQAKEAEERKAREAQAMAHVARQQQEFHKHLDGMGDKYDDFHDVVFGNDAPFTAVMRDYAMTLPRSGQGSAGEVLYKLGKSPDELKRIANLHPIDQASELAKLSHALISGGESKNSMAKPPLGNIKSNPVVNSKQITEKTPVSELRARMKAGFK